MLTKLKLHKGMKLAILVYAIAYMFTIFFFCLPRILAEYGSIDVSRLAENFKLPLDIFSWGFLAICSGYAGMDRKILLDRSQIDNVTVKNRDSLITIIVLLLIIFLESAILNFFLSHDFVIVTKIGKQQFSGIELPLEGIATALVSTLTIYVTMPTEKENKDLDKKETKRSL